MKKGLIVIFLLTISWATYAQSLLSGKIYDRDKAKPLEFAQIFNKTANYQITADKEGNYRVYVNLGDTILFSALGFETQKLIIDKSVNFLNKNIYMQARYLYLPEVMVSGKKSYKADSLEQRQDFARVYNYKDKSFGNLVGTAIFHPLTFIEYLYSGNKRKNIRSFQNRLKSYEQEKFVDNYYNAELVGRISKITDEKELDAFVKYSRPQYDFLKSANQYDLYYYINTRYKKFKADVVKIDSLGVKQ
ncbi:carboxypeptidase-like regulatory domain-containing protein [Solitalea lacus]|uniref:carboxypeptidase-like regulatory domain-containing protein n=1 Tax=Solitalea lacus TaxID=2911172 RepID=UPI001EDAFB95|nr:carboxypeptidase-like regulatory domain-containing protein [Solitalea lacus]UKJ08621.1 carboxypeptidase-like regulatory domain-containing protein [Solitalea lacus]